MECFVKTKYNTLESTFKNTQDVVDQIKILVAQVLHLSRRRALPW